MVKTLGMFQLSTWLWHSIWQFWWLSSLSCPLWCDFFSSAFLHLLFQTYFSEQLFPSWWKITHLYLPLPCATNPTNHVEKANWMCHTHLEFSVLKTELVIFSSQPASPNVCLLLVNNTILLLIQVRNLGLTLNHSFPFPPHSLTHENPSAYTS